jgi:hypothetical protein
LGFSRPIELKIPCNEQAITMHRREGLEGNRGLHPLNNFVCARIASHRFSPGLVTWSLCHCFYLMIFTVVRARDTCAHRASSFFDEKPERLVLLSCAREDIVVVILIVVVGVDVSVGVVVFVHARTRLAHLQSERPARWF